MPGSNIDLIAKISAALVAVGGMWLGIFKYMSFSKKVDENIKSTNDFKKGVDKKMEARAEKVVSLHDDIASLKEEFSNAMHENRTFNTKTFSTKPEVDALFEKQDIRVNRISTEIRSSMDKNFAELKSGHDNILTILCEMKNKRIADLEKENDEYKKKYESVNVKN